jgi:4-amino-4-deoxy-L-arabinose transferase-like glycosyltransferase
VAGAHRAAPRSAPPVTMSTSMARAQTPAAPADAPHRGRTAALRPPAPLAALLLLAALVGVAWALVTPAFQAPDEPAHFGYVQSLAEGFDLPGRGDRPLVSSEQALAGSLSNSDQAAQQLGVRMTWSERVYERWRRAAAALPPSARTDGGGPNPAASNPPLYYLYEAIPYRLGEGGDLFTRLELTRLASVLWMLVTVVGVWLLAGELLARDRLAQAVAAGTSALLPMVGFVSASVNPDAMLYAAWSLALWLGVRLLRRGATLGRVVALFAVVGLACLVKATSYALVPAALLALVVALRRGERSACAGAALVLTLGVWIVVARLTHRAASAQVAQAAGVTGLHLRDFGSYLWQYYLPRLPFQQPFSIPGDHLPAYDVWLKTGWAAFGWLEVRFPEWVYVVLTVVTLAIAVVAMAQIWRARRRVDVAVLAFLALVCVTLLAGLHWTEFKMLGSGRGAFNVGRYLLPLAGIAGLGVALSVRAFAPARRPAVAGAWLTSLFVLNLFSLGLVIERFYA